MQSKSKAELVVTLVKTACLLYFPIKTTENPYLSIYLRLSCIILHNYV